MLIIGAISYHHNVLWIGYLALVAITYGNWVEYNGNVKCKLPFLLGISPLIIVGVLTKRLDLSILGIAIVQGVRTITLYWRSVWNTCKG